MPIYKTNLNVLNQPKPIELELELNSFVGGEDTVSEDVAMKSNQARLIQNWESLSLGGMERSAGFSEVADAPKTIKTAVHSVGTGLSDIASGGTYTETSTAVFTIQLSTTGTPDKFKWKKGDGAYSAEVEITGSAQTLSDGVTITFTATTGHALNDEWTVTAKVYTGQLDLLIQHIETTTTRIYGVLEGDLVYKNSTALTLTDSLGFTSGVLCHGVSKGDKLWITNSTDNLKYKTNSGSLTTPSSQPASARDRIYYHKYRLIAEGGGKTVYGSRVGTGNWDEDDTWDLANDAFSIDFPDNTQGCVCGFPSGGVVTVFTKFSCYQMYNMPNVAWEPIIGGHGCSFPYSIALGSEGVYLLSEFPTYGVFLWNGTQWTDLTATHDFIDDIDKTKRIYGVYREGKYYLIYNESGSGVTYPNRIKIYDARFGKWMTRSINSSLGDSMGYPCVAPHTNNELYLASSVKDKVYEFETTATDDGGYDTQAQYTTKGFTSRDFNLGTGGQFTIDDCRIKLIKFGITMYGDVGNVSLAWRADGGRQSGSQTINFTAVGDLLDSTFILDTSLLQEYPSDKTVFRSFSNKAVGRKFDFDIIQNGSGIKPKIKRIKIYANVLEEA
jgi:hypothetical protein